MISPAAEVEPVSGSYALYVTSETSLAACGGKGGNRVVPDSDVDPVPGTIGKLIPNTECRLVDPDTGRDVRPGEMGELWMRGPQVMRGYLGRPEETAATIDAEGWLHSGDVGRIDEDGNFFIIDRIKELIKYKGYQVAPAELEAVLVAHPEIVDAGVVGVRDGDGEEIPKAFVVRRPGSALDESTLMEYVASHVAPYKKVRAVEFIEALPRSMAGKILRRELRDRTQ